MIFGLKEHNNKRQKLYGLRERGSGVRLKIGNLYVWKLRASLKKSLKAFLQLKNKWVFHDRRNTLYYETYEDISKFIEDCHTQVGSVLFYHLDKPSYYKIYGIEQKFKNMDEVAEYVLENFLEMYELGEI